MLADGGESFACTRNCWTGAIEMLGPLKLKLELTWNMAFGFEMVSVVKHHVSATVGA